MKAKWNATAGALAAAMACMGGVGPALAQTSDQELRQKMDQLQQQLDILRAQLDKSGKGGTPAAPAAGAPAGAAPAAPQATANHDFLERKAGDGVTFFTRGGELSIYGNLDISVDSATKGIGDLTAANAPTSPVGQHGLDA